MNRAILSVGLVAIAFLTPALRAQLYAADSDADQLLTLDTVTGAPTLIGTTLLAGLATPAGLAFDGTSMWVLDLAGGELFTLDVATGVPTMQATTGLSGWQGLAADPTAGGQLYGINQDGTLQSISPTGMLTLISSGAPLITGLEFDSSGQLWGTEFGGQLLMIDKTTGARITVGPTQAGIQGLTWAGSTLYGYSTNNDTLYTLDPMTGMATAVGGPSATQFVKGLCHLGVGCSLMAPAGTAMGDVSLTLTTSSPAAPTVDVTFEFSIDSGVTFSPATAAVSSPLANPAPGTPTGMGTFIWDSLADGVGTLAVAMGVLVRARADDLVSPVPAFCSTAPFDVDNVPLPPTCTLVGPASLAAADITIMLDSASPNSPTVDAVFEFSLDGGATFAPSTAAAGSPLSNPAVGIATGMANFVWDSRTDGAGVAALAPGVIVRATLDDGVSPIMGTCATMPFDIDNTSLCSSLCGDCSSDGTGPNIIDALSAAQIAAGITVPTMTQMGCCDVDSSMSISVLDALLIAQAAAGLPVTLVCP